MHLLDTSVAGQEERKGSISLQLQMFWISLIWELDPYNLLILSLP